MKQEIMEKWDNLRDIVISEQDKDKRERMTNKLITAVEEATKEIITGIDADEMRAFLEEKIRKQLGESSKTTIKEINEKIWEWKLKENIEVSDRLRDLTKEVNDLRSRIDNLEKRV